MGKFNKALKEIVENRGVKIVELSQKVNISRSYLSVLLNKDKIPSDELIQKLASELMLTDEETDRLIRLAHEDSLSKEQIPDIVDYITTRLKELEGEEPKRRHLAALVEAEGFEIVTLTPRGAIRETAPLFKGIWKSVNSHLKSVEFILVSEFGDILLQEIINEIDRKGHLNSFELPLKGRMELDRGRQYRWQVYLNFDQNGKSQRRYLDEILFEVLSVEDEARVIQYEKTYRKQLLFHFLSENLFEDAISLVLELKKLEDRLSDLGQKETTKEEAEQLLELIKRFARHYPYCW